MDSFDFSKYKYIIIAVVIIIICKFIYDNFTKYMIEFSKGIEHRIHNVEHNMMQISYKMQGDINSCVSRIRKINTDSVNQIRKIKLISEQPITDMVNNFSDGDGDIALSNDESYDKSQKEGGGDTTPFVNNKQTNSDIKSAKDDIQKFYMSRDDEQKAKTDSNEEYNDPSCVLNNNIHNIILDELLSNDHEIINPVSIINDLEKIKLLMNKDINNTERIEVIKDETNENDDKTNHKNNQQQKKKKNKTKIIDIDKMTYNQLKSKAKELGIKANLKKLELMDKIKSAVHQL